jgi:molybdopterin converting factor subunit 1
MLRNVHASRICYNIHVQITVRFFAILKDRAGVGEAVLELPSNAAVHLALEAVVGKYPSIAQDLKRCAFAVNREYASTEKVLNDGDELALIPPVSGG